MSYHSSSSSNNPTTSSAGSSSTTSSSTGSSSTGTTTSSASAAAGATVGIFTIQPNNFINEDHVVNVNGVDVPYWNAENGVNPDSVIINIPAGTLCTAYIRYNSSDFTFSAWGGLDGMSTTNPNGSTSYVLDANGEVFNSQAVAQITVAGPLTENRVQWMMPAFNTTITPILTSSTAVGVSPEVRVDLATINSVEFNGETIDKLFIDGVMQWDASLPPGEKFVDASVGVTFLIEDN